MQFRLWLENFGTFVAYHQTSVENAKKIMKRGFSLKNATMGIIWFTNDINALKNDTTGAEGRGAILKVQVTINKAAGWKEYEDLLLMQLRREFDGAILSHKDGTFDGFVFDPKQIKVLGIIDVNSL